MHEVVTRREGLQEWEARGGGVSGPPATHQFLHMPEAALGDIQVHKSPDQLGRREKDGGILLHGLHLLVADEGELGNFGGLGPTALAKMDEATHSLRSCETKGSHKLLASLKCVSVMPSSKCHAKLKKGVPRERHNKSYTREKGGWEWVEWGDRGGTCGPTYPPVGHATPLASR